MGRHKLSEVLAEQEAAPVAAQETKTRKITTEEAAVLCKLGQAQIQHNEKARKALTVYLDHTLGQADIDDNDANAVINILKTAATTTHKDLCDKILTKYLSKFDSAIPQEKK